MRIPIYIYIFIYCIFPIHGLMPIPEHHVKLTRTRTVWGGAVPSFSLLACSQPFRGGIYSPNKQCRSGFIPISYIYILHHVDYIIYICNAYMRTVHISTHHLSVDAPPFQYNPRVSTHRWLKPLNQAVKYPIHWLWPKIWYKCYEWSHKTSWCSVLNYHVLGVDNLTISTRTRFAQLPYII